MLQSDLRPRLVSQPDAQPRSPALRLLQETHFDLDVQDAELRSLLVGLIRNSPFNAVVGSDVQGTVTADLKNTSLFDVLEQIVKPRGYAYEVRGNTISVQRNPVETRTYYVEYPSYTREGNSDLSLYGAIGMKTDLGTSGSSGGGSQDKSSSSMKTSNTQNFWKELDTSLRALVFDSTKEGDAVASERKVLVADQSGLILVRAEHSIQEQVQGLLEEMSKSNQRQVLIDTRVLEVTLTDDFDFGVDIEWTPPLRGDATGIAARLIDASRPDAVFRTQLSPTLTNGGLTIGVASDHLAGQLRALAAQTDVRVVSTPRIATLNNHQALIKVVRNQVFFIAESDVQVVENVGTTVVTNFVPQIVPIGVTLDVTPRIGEDNQITLHIHPSVSEVVSVQAQPSTIPGLTNTGSLPVVDLRETDTVVRVGDGQTIVMGGLMRSRELNQELKTPYLADLPLVGWLFRSTNVEELRTELVILLTPRVLDAPRIVELSSASLDAVDQLDNLRIERRPRRPWWRKPINQSYGAP